jgi:CTP:molybdopterin cytidylyltransferase MocA
MTPRRAAIILAAGDSRRMGTPKAFLPWAGSTLLSDALACARAARVRDLVVVLGPTTRSVADELTMPTTPPPPVQIAFNANPATGRSASIRLGCELLRDDVGAVLIQSVDQPTTVDVLEQLFDAVAAERPGLPAVEVAIPTHDAHRGHPVCFTGALLAELRTVDEATEGLRAVVRRHAAGLVEVPVDTPAVTWNLNDPAAYAAARAAIDRG